MCVFMWITNNSFDVYIKCFQFKVFFIKDTLCIFSVSIRFSTNHKDLKNSRYTSKQPNLNTEVSAKWAYWKEFRIMSNIHVCVYEHCVFPGKMLLHYRFIFSPRNHSKKCEIYWTAFTIPEILPGFKKQDVDGETRAFFHF